jgi:hypothetical protein
VKGVLFADYVRMLRGHKAVDWAKHLLPSDLPYLEKRVVAAEWYPMETFERMGNAILREIAGNELEAVRIWGRMSVDQLRTDTPQLVADGDPLETLMRFRVLRSTYFDFDALEIPTLSDGHADIVIRYHMGPTAEEAASYQTMGFFERLLEVGGAAKVFARFTQQSWVGDARTLLVVNWDLVPSQRA